MTKQANLGETFKQLRLAQNLSRAVLAKRLNFSEKTLQRIEAGTVDLKVTQYVALANYFALTPAALSPLSAELTPQQVLTAIDTANDYTALAAHYQKLAQTHPLPWLMNAVLACQALASQHTNDQKHATELAHRLSQRFLQSNHRTDFCFHLFSKICPLLSSADFDQLAASGIFHRAIRSGQLVDDTIIFNFCRLRQSVMTTDLCTLDKVCRTLMTQFAEVQTPNGQILRRFCEVLALRLINQPRLAAIQFTKLQHAITMLYPESIAPVSVSQLKATEQALSRRIGHAHPCQFTSKRPQPQQLTL